MNRKAKIGVLGLTLKLYDTSSPYLRENREVFMKRVIDSICNHADFSFPGICNTKEMVDKTIKGFENEGVDAVMVVFLSYAPSLIALHALKSTKLPIIIWNTQEALAVDADCKNDLFRENQGVHGVQDLCSVLKRTGVKYKVLSGHWQNQNVLDKLSQVFSAVKTLSILKESKIGLIGHPMQGMGDFYIDEAGLLGQTGASVLHISADEYVQAINDAPEDSVSEIMAKDRKMYKFDEQITLEEHKAAARMEWGIRKLVSDYSLTGWCQLFSYLGACQGIPTMPFLAASKLMGEGIAYSAEGDVSGAVAGNIMNSITGNATLSEMFTVDYARGTAYMKHMGELNTSMARKDRPVNIIRKKFTLADKMCPPTPVFSLEPGVSTLLSLVPGPNGRLQIAATEGEVVDTEVLVNSDTPYFRWKPQLNIEDFLDRYAQAGGSHHQALGYGHVAGTIEILAGYLGIDFIRI